MVLLLLHILVRSLVPPFYSFSMVERICRKRLSRNAQDFDVLWFLANYYVWYGKFTEAKWLLESLLQLRPDSRATKLLLSRVYFQLEKYEDVERLLREPNTLSKRDREHYYLGCSLFELGRFSDAIPSLKHFSDHYKNNYIAFVKLGYAYYKEGSYDNALIAYQRANALKPYDKEILKSIAVCTDKAGAPGSDSKKGPVD